MKINITNIVALNGGDTAILYGMVKALKLAFGPETRFTIYARDPDVCNELYPDLEFRETLGFSANNHYFYGVRYLGRVFAILRKYRYLIAAWGMGKKLFFFRWLLSKDDRESMMDYLSADLILSTGGTYLIEEYGITSQIIDYRISLLLNRPLAFYTQSLGPYDSPQNIKWMKSILPKLKMILLRDEKSYKNILALKLPELPVHITADAAFALMPEGQQITNENNTNRSSLKIAVSVREWKHFKSKTNEQGALDYRKSLAYTLTELAKKNTQITFISTCQGVAEYTDDSIEADLVLNYIPQEYRSNIHITRDYIPFDKICKQLEDFDFLIGTRLHMTILSLISNTPVLPIAYEMKMKELFSKINLNEWVIDIETITPEEMNSKVNLFIQEYPEIKSKLSSKIIELKNEAINAAFLLKDTLDKTT